MEVQAKVSGDNDASASVAKLENAASVDDTTSRIEYEANAKIAEKALGIIENEANETGTPAEAKAIGSDVVIVNAAPATPATQPRAGTKQALVVGMLRTGQGATLGALVEATGWLPHTTRAAMTGLRKRGFAIERIRDETLGSHYRIVGDRVAQALV